MSKYKDNEGNNVIPGATYYFGYRHMYSNGGSFSSFGSLVVYGADGSFYCVDDYENPGTVPIEEDFDFLVRQRLPLNEDFI